MFSKILVASDLTACSRPAVRTGLGLAQSVGGQLVVAYVIDAAFEQRGWFLPETTMLNLRQALVDEEARVRAALEVQLKELSDVGSPKAEIIIEHGIPADVIPSIARRVGADVIVMGTHGRRGFQHAVMGSVAERVLRTAHLPVLVVRAPEATK